MYGGARRTYRGVGRSSPKPIEYVEKLGLYGSPNITPNVRPN